MANKIYATKEEKEKWVLFTLKHSIHVEYFLQQLNLGSDDKERPHDLVGVGNKYTSCVAEGFALQYHSPKVDFETYISPALNLHRKQHHHKMWNLPSPNATRDDLLVGAVDATCSMLENRDYQNGVHSYTQILKIIEKNPQIKIHAFNIIIPEMQKLKQPNLESITTLSDFPNIGLSKSSFSEIIDRTYEARWTILQEAL